MHSANTRLFFQTGPFTHCVFLTICGTFKKKWAPGPIFGLKASEKGRPGTVEDSGSAFWVGRCVVCVCGGCHGCRVRVFDVFLRCAFEGHDAVCHLCAARRDRLSDVLDARPLGCHLIDGEKFLRGMNHARCETSCTVTPAIADRSEGVPFRFFFFFFLKKKKGFFLFFMFLSFLIFFVFFSFFHLFMFNHFFIVFSFSMFFIFLYFCFSFFKVFFIFSFFSYFSLF